MRYNSFQEVVAKYGLTVGLEEQAPLPEWEAALKKELEKKQKEAAARKGNPTLARIAEQKRAEIQDAVLLVARINLFDKLRRCIQDDKQETFEWELDKNQAALPGKEDPQYGDYLDLKGEAKKKWPAVSFPGPVPARPPPPPPPAPAPVPAPAPGPAPAAIPTPVPTPAVPAPVPVQTKAPAPTQPPGPPPPSVTYPSAPAPAVARAEPPPKSTPQPPPPPAPPPRLSQVSRAAVAETPSAKGPPAPPLTSQPVAATPPKPAPSPLPPPTPSERTPAIAKPAEPPGEVPAPKSGSQRKLVAAALALLLLAGLGLLAKTVISHWKPKSTDTSRTTTIETNKPAPVVEPLAYLHVDSSPSGAMVAMNTERKTTPADFAVKPSTYSIDLSLENYTPTNLSVILTAGATNSVAVRLESKPGDLEVASIPSRAFVGVANTNGLSVSGTTPAHFPLPPGTYYLHYRLEGYSATNQTVTIEPGATNSVSVRLQTASAWLVVNTSPGGATVKVNGEQQTTPARFSLPPNTYDVEFELEGYLPSNQSVTLTAGATNNLSVTLDSALAHLRVESSPSVATASLEVNGQKRSQTTPTTFELPPGQYLVHLTLPGYLPTNQTISLKPADTRTLLFTGLRKAQSSLRILTDPVGAQLYINGALYTKDTTPITGLALDPGDYRFQAILKNYRPASTNLHIDARSVGVDFGRLTPLRATVRISSRPTGAMVKLDGGGTGKETPCTLEFTPGRHTITLALGGHPDGEFTAKFEDGDNPPVEIPLKELPPPPPPAPVVVDPAQLAPIVAPPAAPAGETIESLIATLQHRTQEIIDGAERRQDKLYFTTALQGTREIKQWNEWKDRYKAFFDRDANGSGELTKAFKALLKAINQKRPIG